MLIMKVNEKGYDIEPSTWRQWYSAVIVNILCFCHGCTIGWLSPTLPLLSGPNSPLDAPLTAFEIDLIASMMSLAATIFTFFFGWIADKFGRRYGLMISAMPYLICWSIKVMSNCSTSLIIARFFSGIGASGMVVIAPIYCVEIASQSLKGALGSLMVLSINLGILLMYILGMYMTYTPLIWVIVPQPILFMISMYFLPESPPYLLKNKKVQEAEIALAWFNSIPLESEVIKNELTILKDEINLIEDTGRDPIWNIFRSSPATFKAFIVILLLFTIQAFMGMFPITSYAENIFHTAGTDISPSTCSIVLGCMLLVGSFIASSLVDRLGRKFLLLGSSTFVALTLIIMGIYFFVQDSNVDIDGFRIVPVITLSLMVCTFAIGAGPIPYILPSELIIPKIRGLVTGIILTCAWFLFFIVTLSFGPAVKIIGMSGVFILFGMFSLAGIFLIIFYVPETKGRTLEENLAFYDKSKKTVIAK